MDKLCAVEVEQAMQSYLMRGETRLSMRDPDQRYSYGITQLRKAKPLKNPTQLSVDQIYNLAIKAASKWRQGNK